MNFQDLLT